MRSVLLAAGDASGDLHAADFVRAFAQLRPDCRFLGMGGPAMEEAGVELLVHQRELAVGGLFELASGLGGVVRAWHRMGEVLASAQPDLVVLVDSGGFNLPFARRVKRESGAPILYYVAPQVWAWRTGRIRKLAARVDRLAVIFPFETAVYAKSGIEAEFVGHPLVESLSALSAQLDQKQARRMLELPEPGRIVALLPGSRVNEVARHLPLQLEAARRLYERRSDVGFVLALAPPIGRELVDAALRRASLPAALRLSVVSGRTREALVASDLALAKPGTVTIEATLLERPMVVMGRVHAWTAAILRRAVHAPFYAMPNLIAEREIVPELLQEEATPERLAVALDGLLDGPQRTRQLAELAAVRRRLGKGGAASGAARIAGEMLASR